MLPILAAGFKFATSKVFIISGLVAGLIALFGGTYLYGYERGENKAQREADAVELRRVTEVARLNEINRQQEFEHERRINDLRIDFAKRNEAARVEDSAVINDLLVGTKRLRLQVSNCNFADAGEGGTTPGGTDGTGTGELAPETSAAVWGIAGDGDRAIRKLNALQEWAKSAVELCSPKGEENENR